MSLLSSFPFQRILIIGFCLSLGILVSCGVDKPSSILELAETLPDQIDYNFHVKPILADRCFTCHGPDKNSLEAGLRLDISESAYGELLDSPGKRAIVSGNLRKSQLFHRIISEDQDLVMPPEESNLSLTDYEKGILIKWIEQGAEYKPHWSLMPVKVNDQLEKDNNEWGNNLIDVFVSNELKKSNLTPSPQAAKETLIRRIYFDIIGLPPSLEDIDAFLEDESLNAFEKVVDKLLASEEYGERMAAYWMDVARYADSDGYLDDKHRDFTPWRDWVIKAFNENLSYDKFVTWQLAGDLLPDPTQEKILATAFNRLHKKNSEAGIVFDEYRVEYVADRTNTLGKAFLGLSLECARCHDHKYDPISQEDYFSFFGFFNSTDEIGHAVYGPDQTPGPALLLTNQEVEERIAFLTKSEKRFETEVEAKKNEVEFDYQKTSIKTIQNNLKESLVSHLAFDQINSKDEETATTPDLANRKEKGFLRRPEIRKGIKGDAFFVTDYNYGKFPKEVGWYERTDPFSISLWLRPDTIYSEVSVFTHSEDLRLGFKGYSLHLKDNHLQFMMAHSWPQNSIQVTSENPLDLKEWSMVTITYDGSSKANGVKIFVNDKSVELETDFDNLYKGILFEWNIHTYGFTGIEFGSRNKLIPFKKGGIDEFMVFDEELSELEIYYLFDNELDIEKIEETKKQELFTQYAQKYHSPKLKTAKDSLQSIRQKLNLTYNQIPEIMVLGDLPEPRPTYVLERGSYEAPGKEVQPGVAESIMTFSEDLPRNRLGLAKWLFDPDHPLTSRVMVNRLWQMYFGKGLVKTSEDFGNQGSLPSHPELLDYLAKAFIDSDWDMKAIQKIIVMSATYQQSSVISPELREKDPENILLARGPRFRLSAEMIRDNALAMSGLLAQKTGGESTYPYQPNGLWDENTNKHWRYRYLQKPGEGLYRRSLYSIWKRTSPPPSMQIFDIADRDNCTVRRKPTSTPLQALVLLNDPQYQEAARVTAEKIILLNFRIRCCRTQLKNSF